MGNLDVQIGERLKRAREKLGYSEQKRFAEELSLVPQTYARYEKGERNLPDDVKVELIRKGVDPNWLLTGSGDMFLTSAAGLPEAASRKIPLLRQTVSCGPGQEWGDADNVESYIEPMALTPAMAHAKMYAFRVSGTSMVGAGINDGDVLLFDGTPNQDLQDDIYVFALDGKVYCKLVKFDSISRHIEIFSMHNQELAKAEMIKDIDTAAEDTARSFHIFGRVLAWMHENHLCRR